MVTNDELTYYSKEKVHVDSLTNHSNQKQHSKKKHGAVSACYFRYWSEDEIWFKKAGLRETSIRLKAFQKMALKWFLKLWRGILQTLKWKGILLSVSQLLPFARKPCFWLKPFCIVPTHWYPLINWDVSSCSANVGLMLGLLDIICEPTHLPLIFWSVIFLSMILQTLSGRQTNRGLENVHHDFLSFFTEAHDLFLLSCQGLAQIQSVCRSRRLPPLPLLHLTAMPASHWT